MDIKISELPSGNSVNGDDQYPAVQSGSTKKFSPAQMASYVLNTFSSLSLGGVVRTVKAAIDSIAATVASHTTLLGNSTMGTTATTVTGAIAEHETDITTLNSNITPQNISLNAASGFNIATNNSLKIGALVVINIKISGANITASTAGVVASVPSAYRPSSETGLVLNVAAGESASGWIRANGDLVIVPVTTLTNREIRIMSVYHV